MAWESLGESVIESRHESVRRMRSAAGKVGGRNRAANLTAERRRDIAIIAARARWG